MLAQILGALVGRFQETIFAGEHVGRGKAVDQAGDGVGLLAVVVLFLLAAQLDRGAVVAVVHRLLAELRMQIEIADLLDLLHPPVGPLDDILVGLAAQEEDELRLEHRTARLRVEDAVGVQETAGHQHVAHRAGGILVGIPRLRTTWA